MTIALIGPPGAGKSTLAPLLAAVFGLPVRDLDREIERAAERTIAQLFSDEGEAGFRQREQDALQAALAAPAAVIATGAGVVLDPANRALLRSGSRVVLLAADPRLQLERLGPAGLVQRPLLARAADPLRALEQLYAERLPLYRACAQLELDTAARDPDALAVELVARLAALVGPGR